MATIEIKDDNLVIHIIGVDKLLSLRSQLTVPLKDIRSVAVRPADARGQGEVRAYRVAGAFIPGTVTAGYFWVAGGLGTTPKPSIEALHRAKTAVEEWTYDTGGFKQRAVEYVTKAIEEVTNGAQEGRLNLEEEGKGWAFYDLHDPDKTIGIDVEHAKVRRIVIEVDGITPEEAVQRIKAATAK